MSRPSSPHLITANTGSYETSHDNPMFGAITRTATEDEVIKAHLSGLQGEQRFNAIVRLFKKHAEEEDALRYIEKLQKLAANQK